ILVPTNGSQASRNAAELGFALASDTSDEVLILHVIMDTSTDYFLDAEGEMLEKQLVVGQQVVHELRELGRLQGVQTNAVIKKHPEPETVILQVAKEQNIDLI